MSLKSQGFFYEVQKEGSMGVHSLQEYIYTKGSLHVASEMRNAQTFKEFCSKKCTMTHAVVIYNITQ